MLISINDRSVKFCEIGKLSKMIMYKIMYPSIRVFIKNDSATFSLLLVIADLERVLSWSRFASSRATVRRAAGDLSGGPVEALVRSG